MEKLSTLVKLTRYKEYYGADLLVTSFGIYFVQPVEYYQILFIIIANFLSTAFAFMINDIEDADDDYKDSKRKKRNPISNGNLSRNEAYIGTLAVAVTSLFIYSSLNPLVFLFGATKIVLSLLYSWRKVRLKSMPVIDIVSQSLFGLLSYLSALALYPSRVSFFDIVLIGGAIGLSAALGDIRAEIRDFKADQKSGLNNTARYLNLFPFKKYHNHAEIAVLLVIIVYFVLDAPRVTTVLFLAVIVGTSIHFYKNYLSKSILVIDYPERQISFTLISLILLLNQYFL